MYSQLVDLRRVFVKMLDDSKPPPLKEGRSYPERVEDINVNDYLYTHRRTDIFFFAANIINRKGETVPFPNGVVYEWTVTGGPTRGCRI